jgi:hypothetical protein
MMSLLAIAEKVFFMYYPTVAELLASALRC